METRICWRAPDQMLPKSLSHLLSPQRLIHRCIQHADWGSSIALRAVFNQQEADWINTTPSPLPVTMVAGSTARHSGMTSHASSHLITDILHDSHPHPYLPHPTNHIPILNDLLQKSATPRQILIFRSGSKALCYGGWGWRLTAEQGPFLHHHQKTSGMAYDR